MAPPDSIASRPTRDRRRRDPDDLTVRETRFVAEYIVDFNGGASALRAGYKQTRASARVTASRLLIKPNVREAVADGQRRQIQASEVKAHQVVQELGRVAFSDIRDVLDDDFSVRPVGEWTNGVAQAVSTVDSNGTTVTRVRFHDKMSALGLLGRHFNLFEREAIKGEIVVSWKD